MSNSRKHTSKTIDLSPEAVAQRAISVVATKRALRVLRRHDVEERNPWLRGGCYVFAEALATVLGEEATVRGLANGLSLNEHAVVAYKNRFIDAAGAHTESELTDKYIGSRLQDGFEYPYSSLKFMRMNHDEAVEELVPLLRRAIFK